MNSLPSKWLVAVAIGFGFVLVGCANTGAKRQATPATADHPEPGKGLVIFYRESHFVAGGVGYAIRDVEEHPNIVPIEPVRPPKVGALPNGSYFVYQAASGEHRFAGADIDVWRFGVGSRELNTYQYCPVNVESNTTYYIRADPVGIRTDIFGKHHSVSPSLGVVDSAVGAAAIKNLKRVSLSR